jgi:hypothetical protein
MVSDLNNQAWASIYTHQMTPKILSLEPLLTMVHTTLGLKFTKARTRISIDSIRHLGGDDTLFRYSKKNTHRCQT